MEHLGFFEHWLIWRDAMIVAILSAVTLGYLGVWIVLRQVVFVPLALSQVSSFGLVLSAFIGSLIGSGGAHAHESGEVFEGLLLSILASVLLGLWLARPKEERAQAVVSAYIIASAGVLLVGNLVTQELQDIEAVLFGSAVLVETYQVFIVGAAALLVGLIHVLYYRRFLFVSFDVDAAGASGVPVFFTEALLMSSFAVMIAVVTQAIGALCAFGFMILPGMFGLRIASNLRMAFISATVLGLVSASVGYYVSFRFDTPTGATMVGVAALGYLLSLAKHKTL